MILSCPACQTTFVVADATFGTKRRRVRCSKCQHDWQAEPPVNPLPIPADITPAPEAPRPIPKGSNVPAPLAAPTLWQQHGSKAMTAAGALFCLYLLVAILGSAGIKLWPPSFMTAAPESLLALEDVKTRYEAGATGANGEPTFALIVEGLVRNTGPTPAAVPPIVVELKNKSGKVLASQTASLQTQTLPPAQNSGFIQTFDNPPEDIADITVAFHTNADDTLINHNNKEAAEKQHE